MAIITLKDFAGRALINTYTIVIRSYYAMALKTSGNFLAHLVFVWLNIGEEELSNHRHKNFNLAKYSTFKLSSFQFRHSPMSLMLVLGRPH
jgi:hypothetical protein